MQRDVQFEVQFLLSLTLVIFGILSAESLSKPINPWVGNVLIFLLSFHFSVFTIFYAFSQASNVSVDLADRLEEYSWPILFLISGGFIYFLSHTITAQIHSQVLQGSTFTSTSSKIAIKFVVPLLVILGMALGFKRFVFNPLNTVSDINIKVIPSSIRVFQSKDESRPLTVKIENDGDEEFPYEIKVDIPEDITLHEGSSEYQEGFTEEGSVSPGYADRRNFELSHNSLERSSDVLSVVIDFDGGSQTHEVETRLEL